MFVCSCHAFTDKDVVAVASRAGLRVGAVYGCLGCSPKCGRCAVTIRRLLDGVRAQMACGASERCACCPAALEAARRSAV